MVFGRRKVTGKKGEAPDAFWYFTVKEGDWPASSLPFIGYNRRARNSGEVDTKEEKGSLGKCCL